MHYIPDKIVFPKIEKFLLKEEVLFHCFTYAIQVKQSVPFLPILKDHSLTQFSQIMATKRTVLRSSAGKKLYAVRNEDGTFKDIQSYKKAHGADIKKKAKAEAPKKAAKKAAPKKAAKKAAPKKAAKKAAPKKAAKKAAPKKAAKKAAKKK